MNQETVQIFGDGVLAEIALMGAELQVLKTKGAGMFCGKRTISIGTVWRRICFPSLDG